MVSLAVFVGIVVAAKPSERGKGEKVCRQRCKSDIHAQRISKNGLA